jgi:2'-5' RNA ligase
VRCFLAVPLVEPALAEAQRLHARLRDDVASVRWARPETLHITVYFFGQIDDQERERALAAVGPVVALTPSVALELDLLGSFPSRDRARVLWLGTSRDAAAFTRLALACREALHNVGFAVDGRWAFRLHCTLGRPRLPWPQHARDAWAQACTRPLAPMRSRAEAMVLYESRPQAGGSVYEVRATLPFAAA